jgi:hypothetical protein
MGQGAHELNGVERGSLETEPRRIEREIDALRAQLDELVDELDRRRHGTFDWKRQLRRHPLPLVIGAGALAAGLALAARRRRPQPLSGHLATLVRGLYAVGEHPERLEPASAGPGLSSLATQLARTAALAGASVLVRRFARRALGEHL